MFDQKGVRPELEAMGFKNVGDIYWNATTPHLYEEIVRRWEGMVSGLTFGYMRCSFLPWHANPASIIQALYTMSCSAAMAGRTSSSVIQTVPTSIGYCKKA